MAEAASPPSPHAKNVPTEVTATPSLLPLLPQLANEALKDEAKSHIPPEKWVTMGQL